MKQINSRYFKIGLVLVVAFGIIIWGINFLKGKNFFIKENAFYVIYDRIDGLVESSPVMLNGYKIGQVRDIRFVSDNSGRIIVDFAIRKNIQLRDSTVAKISSIDLMGTKSIEIVQGNSTKFHNSGDTLIASVEQSIKDQVSIQMLPLKVKAEDLMLSLDSVLAVVQYIFNENTRENIANTFISIKKTIQNLEEASIALDTLMQTEKGKLSRIFSNIESITMNLKNNNENINYILKNFSNISDSLSRADIANTINNANKALSDVNTILNRINRGEGTIGQLAKNDTLYFNLEEATYNLNKLLYDMQKNPKKYVHFSLFDFGKTVNTKDEKQKK